MRPCVEKCMVFLFGKIKDIIIKNLVFKPLFVNKSILFSSYFSCFKNENKKEKERVFYKRKTWRYGEIFAKIAGNWLRMINYKLKKSFIQGLFLCLKCCWKRFENVFLYFGALTISFQKGQKSYFSVKNRWNLKWTS